MTDAIFNVGKEEVTVTEVLRVPMPGNLERVETGPVQFGDDDWPGVFIRGDNALFFATAVEQAMYKLPRQDWALIAQLRGLASDLRACSVGNTGWPPVEASEMCWHTDDKDAMLTLQAAGLVALAQFNIPPDIQELLLRGDPAHDIRPGALLGLIRLLFAKATTPAEPKKAPGEPGAAG